MDLIEQARMLFKDLEEKNPKEASEVARRAFRIHDQLAEIRA